MLKKFVVGSLVCLGLLAVLVAGLSVAEEPTPAVEEPSAQTAVPKADAPLCTAVREQDQDAIATDQPTSEAGWDPATCGTCRGYCSSDNVCHGKLLGDKCDNVNNRTCQAFTGCALFNCCFCG